MVQTNGPQFAEHLIVMVITAECHGNLILCHHPKQQQYYWQKMSL
jgi:hypothetical protein